MLDYIKALADSNALAIMAGAVAAFMIGAAWYSPALFAKRWIKELGWKEKDMDKAKIDGSFTKSLAASFVATVLLSLTISVLLNLLDVSGLWNGIGLGLFVALGLTATTTYIHYVYERRSWRLLAINAGYNVAMCVVIGGVLGVWPR